MTSRFKPGRFWKTIKSILLAAGASTIDIVKTTVFLKNLDDFNVMNEIYRAYFPKMRRRRSTVEVARIPRGALIEIEAIAVINKEK